ncbi:DUF2691 family protein [Aciduricibacillus chroicocephali]|uniref:DUF2691 family protein n=1 Tax=Aciduricibacillus chroicocephali TaxID=3054939 RepID=A0ABY9KWY8_9BACI|nr:DUF2691 family protein [Bacillaceae bacterium 44XB]
MLRGVNVSLSESDGVSIRKLLEPMNFSAYCWKIDRDESYGENDQSLFPLEDTINGEEVNHSIKHGDSYTIYFLDMKAFPSEADMLEIETYHDFLESACEIIILVADGAYIEIYAKDFVLLKDIYENALKNSIEKVEYITEENDGRTRMTVW